MIEKETEADYVKCKCGHYKKNHSGIGACHYCANILTNGLGMTIARECDCQHFEPAETLKKKYYLINSKTKQVKEGIIIDEVAKEDFKKMMKWNEKDWKKHTCVRFIK